MFRIHLSQYIELLFISLMTERWSCSSVPVFSKAFEPRNNTWDTFASLRLRLALFCICFASQFFAFCIYDIDLALIYLSPSFPGSDSGLSDYSSCATPLCCMTSDSLALNLAWINGLRVSPVSASGSLSESSQFHTVTNLRVNKILATVCAEFIFKFPFMPPHSADTTHREESPVLHFEAFTFIQGINIQITLF